MQTIKHNTIMTVLYGVLAMLAGACDDEHEASSYDLIRDQADSDGEITEPAPWLVSIQRQGGAGTHWCSGAIITETWILTAAHCVEGKALGSLQVRAGLGDTGTEQLRLLAAVEQHPRYVRRRLGHDHDLALLRLREPLDLSGVGAAAIEPGSSTDLEPASSGVMGLVRGRSSPSPDEDLDVLQMVLVELLSNADARAIDRTPISPKQIASKPMEGQTCQADAGSPLVLATVNGPRLVGVASEGTGCSKLSSPQIYARVSSYLEWIEAEIRETQP